MRISTLVKALEMTELTTAFVDSVKEVCKEYGWNFKETLSGCVSTIISIEELNIEELKRDVNLTKG